jgi:hypothetical protein
MQLSVTDPALGSTLALRTPPVLQSIQWQLAVEWRLQIRSIHWIFCTFTEVHEGTRMSFHTLQKAVTGELGYEGLTQNYDCSTTHTQRGLLYLQYKNSKANGTFQISNNNQGKVLWLLPTRHIFYPLPPTEHAAMSFIPSNGFLIKKKKNNAHEHWIINWARLIRHMLMGYISTALLTSTGTIKRKFSFNSPVL